MRIFPVLSWLLIPGCWALTGPRTVTGPAGGSVSVRCSYDRGHENNPKFWCRAGPVLCADGRIAESSGTEAEVKRGRVSLRDNHTLSSFTVTVRNLTAADAGPYQCGIARTGQFDLRQPVEVIVSPETAAPTPSATGRSPRRPKQPASPPSPKSTSTWTAAEEGPSSSSTNEDDTSPGAQLSNIHFLLLALWKVPILLCIIGVNVWYRKTCREMPGRHRESLQIPTLSSQL